tara:strand:+ start:5054 stop:5551 length:498 start_codon:yes stop_codon:yes gene_type:complete
MDFKSVGKKISEYAPLLGSVVGGPAGGALGSLVASAFGVENNPVAIMAAVNNDPEAAVKLREIELNNKSELERIELEKALAHIDNMKDARKSHKHNHMPAVICCLLTLFVGLGAYGLFTINIPPENKEIAYLLFGTLLAKWGDSIAYWVGTTRSSQEKTAIFTKR